MPSGAHAVPGDGMIKAVFDANVLVSAFLSETRTTTRSLSPLVQRSSKN